MKELRAGPELLVQKTARDYSSRDDQGSVQTEHFDGGFMLLPLQQHFADRGASPRLVPELSGNQLFFVAFAQGWCGRVRDELAMQRLSSDPHSPGAYRVRGPVMNSKAFAQSFGCCSGSKMNPPSKCSVWTDPS